MKGKREFLIFTTRIPQVTIQTIISVQNYYYNSNIIICSTVSIRLNKLADEKVRPLRLAYMNTKKTRH